MTGFADALSILQRDLAGLVASNRETGYSDSSWLGMSSKTRGKCILRGLLISTGVVVEMEECRQWCPETTTTFLQRDGGKTFRDLLSTAVDTPCGKPPSEDLRTESILVSLSGFDGTWHIGEPCPLGENEAAREVMQNHVSLSRNFYLTFFLWNTISTCTASRKTAWRLSPRPASMIP